MRTTLCALAALSLASCASVPTFRDKAALDEVDAVELFRRARFSELARSDAGGSLMWAHRLRPSWVPEGEDLADWSARVAYRCGDGAAARRADARMRTPLAAIWRAGRAAAAPMLT